MLRKLSLLSSLLLIVTLGISQKLYIAENGSQAIQRSDLDGTNLSLISSPITLGAIKDIAIDEIENNIYWIENSATNAIVKRAKLDPTLTGVQLNTTEDFVNVGPGIDQFEGLAIDIVRRYLYITNKARIERISLDAIVPVTVLPAPIITGLFDTFGIDFDKVNDKIFFVNMATNRQIMTANFVGGSLTIVVNDPTQGIIHDVAVDPVAGNLYFSTNISAIGEIRKTDLIGTNPTPIVSSLASGLMGVAVDASASQVYWADGGGNVGRAKLDGSSPGNIVTGLNGVNYVTLDLRDPSGPKMYWTEALNNYINRANRDGTSFEEYYTGFSLEPQGIAFDPINQYIYWTDNDGEVKRGVLGETGFISWELLIDQSTSFARLNQGISLDLSGGKMYWASNWDGSIKVADFNDPSPISTLQQIRTGLSNPRSVAVDPSAGVIYYTENTDPGDNIGELHRFDLVTLSDIVLFSDQRVGFDYLFNDVKLDVANNKIYWSVGEVNLGFPGLGEIFSADLSNVAGTATSFATPGQVIGIDLDIANGKIYWVDRGVVSSLPPGIIRADIGGANQEILRSGASENIFQPNFIALNVAPVALVLSSTTPTKNQTNVLANSDITFTFDQNVNAATVNNNNIIVTGEQTGIINGTFSGGGTPIITFNPTSDFKPGEIIATTLTAGLQSTSGGALQSSASYKFLAANVSGPDIPDLFVESPSRIISNTIDAFQVHAADIDRDGDIDVAAIGLLDDKVAWYSNDGSASFTEIVIASTGLQPKDVFATDLDLDGDIDLLVAFNGSDEIAWFDNNGSQFFTERSISGSASFVEAVFPIDLDADGDMDVVAANEGANEIAWYENDGAMGFGARVISNTMTSPRGVYAADIDSDGDLDVLSASLNADELVWFENDGAQNFAPRTISAVPSGPWAVFATDFDLDGDMDLMSGSEFADEVAWYENDGSQNFSIRSIANTTDGVRWFSVNDIDADGDLDIATASDNDSKIAWYENVGFVFTEHVITTNALMARGIFLADLDGDNDLDAISASEGDDKVAWYENTLIFNLTNTTPSSAASNVNVASNIVLDFNLNVEPSTLNSNNIIISGEQTGLVSGVLSGGGSTSITFDPTNDFKAGEVIRVTVTKGLQNTSGDFLSKEFSLQFTTGSQPAPDVPPYFIERILSSSASGTFGVFPADIDGDGDMDAVGTASGSNGVLWFENDGSQNFTERIITTTSVGPTGVSADDVDRDGDMDILVASQSDARIIWFDNDGNENFTERDISTTAGAPSNVYTVDIDGDGDVDAISTSYAPSTGSAPNARLNYHINDGSQNFTQFNLTNVNGTGAYPIDVDGDGDVDIVGVAEVAALSPTLFDKVAWYENDGSQNFTERIIVTPSPARPVDTYATDMDGDGDVDILVAALINSLGWYENDGSQNFTEHEIGSGESQPREIYAADIDGDGDMDVLSVHELLDEVALWINDGSQNFTRQSVTTSADLVFDVYAADMDSDGDMDILSASRFGSEISWYENTIFVNSVPLLASTSSNIIYAGSPIIINSLVTITDADNVNLTSATVQITPATFISGEDDLLFTDQNGITGVYNNTTGVLDLTGSSSLANYETALRSVQYQNLSGTPTTTSRAIEFAVNDGIDFSNILGTTLAIAIGNQPPVFTPSTLTTVISGSVSLTLANIVSDPDGNLDPTTFNIVQQPTSGAVASISNGVLTIDYATTTFAGLDNIIIEVFDLVGARAEVTIAIQVDGDVIVRNGVSPNGDGLNDFFRLDNITTLEPNNKVSIYNRWGDKVFEVENYDNDDPTKRFNGQSDNGKDLSSGVYFYKITFASGSSELSGYLTLKR